MACSSNHDDHAIDFQNYRIEPGFELSVAAAEPLIQSPVAMVFDDRARIWVVEMPGYMPDIAGDGEDAPNGRITILEDADGDGRADRAKVFLDGLVLPRALALVYNGLLYAEPPNLWFVPIEAGDQPGEKVLVDSLFAVGGNVEHQPNGLLFNHDNWIYCAKSRYRYRRINGEWIKAPTAFRGQWGISNDDFGRLYFNDNSNQLAGDWMLPGVLTANPHYRPRYGAGKQLTRDQRLYPLHATAVNRGYQEGILDEEGKVVDFTSACGPVIYRGGQFPAEYDNNAFVCAPEANLVKRNILSAADGKITAQQAWQGKEFLASTDDAFRPVNLYNGPDGALYIVDFHRGIIQHKTYMTSYLREQIEKKGLDTIVGEGRILRVTAGQQPVQPPVDLTNKTPEELTDLLDHPNAWVRERAREKIVFGGVLPANLKAKAADPTDPGRQILALWALEGLDQLDGNTLNAAAQSTDDQAQATVARLSGLSAGKGPLPPYLEQWLLGEHPIARRHAAHAVAEYAPADQAKIFDLLCTAAAKFPQDTIMAEAIVSGVEGLEKDLQATLKAKNLMDSPLNAFLEKAQDTQEQMASMPTPVPGSKPENEDGLTLYRLHCSGCHGMNGEGLDPLAPPLYKSDYVLGKSDNLIRIALFGLTGPITIQGQKYQFNTAMPALGASQEIRDRDIAAILNFVQNAFGDSRQDIKADRVAELRNDPPANGSYTAPELAEK